MYSCIALDMDGTLLDSNKNISIENQMAIEKAVQNHKNVIVNTGRGFSELQDYQKEFKNVRFYNCISGALVKDKNKIIYSKPLDIDIVRRLISISKQEDVMLQLLGEESVVQKDKISHMNQYGIGVYQPMYERVCQPFDDLEEEYNENPFPVPKVNFHHSSTEARNRTRNRIQKEFPDLVAVDSEQYSLEITCKGIDKGRGLKEICHYLQIPLSELIVVGDADNDLEALKAAGLSIGMGNANQNVKNMVDVIVNDNDHSGVARAIYEYLLKE